MQITGGKLNHTTTLSYTTTGERLVIVQHFRNLNAYDQLDLDVDITGSLPNIPADSVVSYKDADLEYNKNYPGRIVSRGRLTAIVNDVENIIEIDQQVRHLCHSIYH